MRILSACLIFVALLEVAWTQPPDETPSIEELQQQYRDAEQRAAKTAASIRVAGEADDRSDGSVKKLEQQLRNEIHQAFKLRLQVQQLLLADAERKLAATRRHLDRREALATEIIERRYNDLIGDTDTDWESDPLASPVRSDLNRPTLTQPTNSPVGRISNYRKFLLNSIGAIKARRGDRLESIAELEQVYLEGKPAQRPPGDHPPEVLERFKKGEEEYAERSEAIKNQMKTLADEVRVYEQQIEALREKLDQSMRDRSDPVALYGRVLEMDNKEELVINLGGQDGVASGMKLDIVREGRVIGSIEVSEVQSNTATARILDKLAGSEGDVRSGDGVALRLDSYGLNILGLDDGVSIYNDELKRFKFQLEHIDVYDVAEAGQKFWRRYIENGNPEIKGVWGDPRTNSLVIIAPPEAEQAIREAIARDESIAATGFDPGPSDALAHHQRRLTSEYNDLVEEIAEVQLQLIDVGSETNLDEDRLKELEQRHADKELEFKRVAEKLRIVVDGLSRRATVDN